MVDRFCRVLGFAVFQLLLCCCCLSVRAQDRQIELNADLPAKRGIVTSDIVLAGRLYLPMTDRFTVVADLSFKDAVNLFLQPTDQISAQGEVWYYLTSASADNTTVRPFVFGGVARSLFIGEPDATNGLAGFGIAFRRPSGFHLIPVVEFSSDGFESERVTLGRAYSARAHIHIPLSKEFNLNLTPKFARVDYAGGYRSEYSLAIGFGRKF